MAQPAVNFEDGGRRDWTQLIPAEEWRLHRAALGLIEERNLQFAIGGGLAFSEYSGRWRYTKDIDLFVLPRDRQAFVDAITEAGFEDMYDQEPYDRAWIYRGIQGEAIIDIIWQMANARAEVDEEWLRGPSLSVHGLELRLIPLEELIWAKVYVLQRERTDWPDLLNLLNTQADDIDWRHLIERMEGDRPLLAGLVSTFSWMCPDTAQKFPSWLWPELGLERPQPNGSGDRARVDLLDSRDWFGPTQEES
jgi:hypothetical protein